VLAAHRLEDAAAGLAPEKLFIEDFLEAVEIDGERVQSLLGNGTAAQRVDDLGTA